MTAFYVGSKRWTRWLNQKGVPIRPDSVVAKWPDSMKCEVQKAEERWRESLQRVGDWEQIIKPLLLDWLYYSNVQHGLSDETKHYQHIQYLLQKFRPMVMHSDEIKLIQSAIEEVIGNLSCAMVKKVDLLEFYVELRGSMSERTKIGPVDEFDYRAHLSVFADDPILQKLYPTMWSCLRDIRHQQNSADDLQLLGYQFHSAKLPALVFMWKKQFPIKVDLTPVAHGDPWTGKRSVDPLGKPFTSNLYILLHGSHSAEPTCQQPVCKPDSSVAEDHTLSNIPPLLKEAYILLKILTSNAYTPFITTAVPKSCKISSYKLKDAMYWTIHRNGLHEY